MGGLYKSIFVFLKFYDFTKKNLKNVVFETFTGIKKTNGQLIKSLSIIYTKNIRFVYHK